MPAVSATRMRPASTPAGVVKPASGNTIAAGYYICAMMRAWSSILP